MKRIVGLLLLAVAAAFTMVGCGSGGGDGGGIAPPVTPPGESLQGTYSLTGFQVNYSNGASFNEHSSIITSWSGTMKIGTNTISQTFVLNGTTGGGSGTLTITWTTDNVAGIAHVTDQSGTHDVAFTISGNDLTTYSGIVQSGTPGLTVEEWDYWTKVSDSFASVQGSSVTGKTDGQAYRGNIGSLSCWLHN